MSRLIVLSNRVSLPDPSNNSAGGLAVAVQDALHDIGGIWLGWNGQQIDNHKSVKFEHIQQDNIEFITCPLQQSQYQQYYCGFANNTLWPAMHERADLIEFKSEEYASYQQVNQFFAEKLYEIAQPDDLIWVHDYHFFSIAHYCRKLGMRNRIGFFLHIPFASASIWEKLPEARTLLQDLTQYDVLGLQTQLDQQKCMQLCQNSLKFSRVQDDLLIQPDQQTRIKCYPIGINPEVIQQAAQRQNQTMKSIFDFEDNPLYKTIIGVDRIDYSKGLLERFGAFECFLQQHPEYHQHIVDLQVAGPSRMDITTYQDFYLSFMDKIKQINQDYATADWTPINCTQDVVEHDELMQIYQYADICWVSSLKDGMNLVAKEYIAAQDPDNPGVLILSKYAGAAEQMTEAVLVDPNNEKQMVKSLETALFMSKEERIERYQQLMLGIEQFDINDWRNAFLHDLQQPIDEPIYMHKAGISSRASTFKV
ncbi:alpha,alpha-trehalose-phosphate synthase (UDP-forming) [Acinetobacter sp.]|uniref:alpha,alpha-trehalose-phosphate synthase (UDP-forming) n=1 Tax=Acinetobacter sp. TaxID=472 RepID=UPI003B00668E